MDLKRIFKKFDKLAETDNCHFCKKDTSHSLAVQCGYCQKYFCEQHQEPKDHNCQKHKEYWKKYKNPHLQNQPTKESLRYI